jgi:glycosyltransferase involved in cell wall biosynthesis
MGGAETLIMNLYRHIDRSQIQFDFAVHSADKGIYDDEIRRLGGKIYYFTRFNGVNFIQYRNAWHEFFKQHHEHKIVHGHIGSCAALYLHFAHKFGKITIAHSHCILNQEFSIRNALWMLYSYPTRYIADYFFGCSFGAGADRFGLSIVQSDRFAVLNNAIDSPLYVYNALARNTIRRSFNIKDDAFVIGHIGRLDAQKNHRFLLEVFCQILQRRPNSHLLLIGDGSLKAELIEEINLYKLHDYVTMTGIRQDIPNLLSAMDVFVFPSLFEGLGIAAVEAQAAGLPTFCSDVIPRESAVSELVRYFPLSSGANEWAHKILTSKITRVTGDMSPIIKAHKYDITETASMLQKFYLDKYQAL